VLESDKVTYTNLNEFLSEQFEEEVSEAMAEFLF